MYIFMFYKTEVFNEFESYLVQNLLLTHNAKKKEMQKIQMSFNYKIVTKP